MSTWSQVSEQVFTGGLKDGGRMGAGVWMAEFGACILVRLIYCITAYTAEMVDVMVRLRWVEEGVMPLWVVMCSESAAALS